MMEKGQAQVDALYLMDSIPPRDGLREDTPFDDITEAEQGLLLTLTTEYTSRAAWLSATRIIPFTDATVTHAIYSTIVEINGTRYFLKPCTSWSPAVFCGICDSFATFFDGNTDGEWAHVQLLDAVCEKLEEIIGMLQKHTKETIE